MAQQKLYRRINMKKTLFITALMATSLSATYNFENIQRVDDINSTLQTATRDVAFNDGKLTFTKVSGLSTVEIDLSDLSSGGIGGVELDSVTKKLVFTLSDGTTKDVDLSGAFDSVDMSDVTYTKASKELMFTFSDGTTKTVTVDIDKSDIGLGDVDNTSDIDKPISTATQTALDLKVDAEAGKVLSSNDFTDADIEQIAKISDDLINDVNLSGRTITVTKVDGTKSSFNLSDITMDDLEASLSSKINEVKVTDVSGDESTKKITSTLSDGTIKDVDISTWFKELSSGAVDLAGKKISMTLSDGSKVDVDISSIVDGLSENDLTDELKDAIQLKKVEDITSDANGLVITYTDATTANIAIDSGGDTNINLDSVAYDKTTNVFTYTLTDGAAKTVTIDLSEYAKINGDASENFKIAKATSDDDALRKDQLLELSRIIVKDSSGKETEISTNEINLYNDRGEATETRMQLNMADDGSSFTLSGNSDGDTLKYSYLKKRWEINSLPISTFKNFNYYRDNEYDSMISDVNIYGTTTATIGRVELKGGLVGDMVYIQGYLNIVDFTKTLPTSSDFTFKYNLAKTIKDVLPEVDKITDGTTYTPISVVYQDADTLNGVAYTRGDDGLLYVTIQDSSNVSGTFTNAKVYFNINLRIDRI
jgi:hypothetical protein